MTTRRMRIASWIPKATNIYSEYVTLIAFALQQWLHKRVSLLRHTYIVGVAYSDFILLVRVCCWLQIRATPTILPYMTTHS